MPPRLTVSSKFAGAFVANPIPARIATMSSIAIPVPSTIAITPLAPQPLDQGLLAVDAEQHDHEQEQHHDRARVHDDLHGEQERRAQDQVEHGDA